MGLISGALFWYPRHHFVLIVRLFGSLGTFRLFLDIECVKILPILNFEMERDWNWTTFFFAIDRIQSKSFSLCKQLKEHVLQTKQNSLVKLKLIFFAKEAEFQID